MKYNKRKDISVLCQAPCTGGIGSGHTAVCFLNLGNNPAASSLVLIAQETWWAPQPVWMLWRNVKPPASAGNKTFIPLSSSLWFSHYSNWPIPAPFVRRKYKREYKDLRERGYGGMNWTEMYLTWPSWIIRSWRTQLGIWMLLCYAHELLHRVSAPNKCLLIISCCY